MAKPDLESWFQREQLHRAAQAGDLVMIESLLAAEYPVNRFDDLSLTPLHYAARGGHLFVVDQLIKAGANVNANDKDRAGNTPLGDIAENCTFEMAKKLIDSGADPAIPGWMQLTAIDRAERRKDADATKILHLLRDAAKRR
jgi:ankyrin repeat protein